MAAAERAPGVVMSAGPELEPVPVPECDVCEPCGREREAARRAGRSLAVRSLNGVIAGHPHGRETRA
ncbi:hypothetical protein BKA18_006180 [Streptomyces auratus]